MPVTAIECPFFTEIQVVPRKSIFRPEPLAQDFFIQEVK